MRNTEYKYNSFIHKKTPQGTFNAPANQATAHFYKKVLLV